MQRFSKFDALPCFVLAFLALAALSVGQRHQLHNRRPDGRHQSDPEEEDAESSERSPDISGPRRPPLRRSVPDADFPGDNESLAEQNCSHCGLREAKRSYRVEAVKADILWKLRMNVPPNVTGRSLPDIPQIRRIIEHHSHPSPGSDCSTHPTTTTSAEDNYDDSFATTLKYVLFAQRAPASVAGSASNVFYFQFQSEMSHQQIVSAMISIYVRRTPNPGLSATWLLLYRLGQLPSSPGESQERETMRRRRIEMSSLRDSGQWFSFDIKLHVERWISHQNVSYGIMVQVSDGRGEPLAVVQPQTSEEADRKPYLIIRVRDQGTPRMKRTLDSDCDESSAESRCCRYPLTIDFEQFGWDWVIVPKRYPAYYCSGECPYHYYQHNPHTGLVQQATKLPGSAGGPCCAPRKVSPISMLYYDEYMNIIYGRLPGMIVDQCGCS